VFYRRNDDGKFLKRGGAWLLRDKKDVMAALSGLELAALCAAHGVGLKGGKEAQAGRLIHKMLANDATNISSARRFLELATHPGRTRPTASYKRSMPGVDRVGQFLGYIPWPMTASSRWPFPVFVWFVRLALLNSYAVYINTTATRYHTAREKLRFKEFAKNVAQRLVEKYQAPN